MQINSATLQLAQNKNNSISLLGRPCCPSSPLRQAFDLLRIPCLLVPVPHVLVWSELQDEREKREQACLAWHLLKETSFLS